MALSRQSTVTVETDRSLRKSRKDRKGAIQKSGAKSIAKTNLYQIPKLNFEELKVPKKPEVRKVPGIDDYLLEDISQVQREYIIKELYPLLKQSIMHVSFPMIFHVIQFVNISIQTDDYKNKVDKLKDVHQAVDLNKDEIDQIRNSESESKQYTQQQDSSFGGFKMGGNSAQGGGFKMAETPAGAFGGFKMTETPKSEAPTGGAFGAFKMTAEPEKPAFGGFKIQPAPEVAKPSESSFSGFKMGEQPSASVDSFRMAQSEKPQQQQAVDSKSTPAMLFNQCYSDVINNRVQKLNPNIFKTISTPQNIPNADYRNRKRGSVFQKVDLNSLDFSKIPNHKKSKKQMDEIIPLLKKNFLTKNLNDDEILQLAGSMKPMTFLKKELLIKYGDFGQEYFILSKGSVKITVYNKGTDPNDPNIES